MPMILRRAGTSPRAPAACHAHLLRYPQKPLPPADSSNSTHNNRG